MSYATLIGFAVTCLVIELTPGPNMAYLAVLSIGAGRRAGFAAIIGIATGLLLVGIGAALGLTAVLNSSRWLYETWRWSGALYLLWLAWEGWQGDKETSPSDATVYPSDAKYFIRGLITNLLNPKAGLFYVAILPTFFEPTQSVIQQGLILSALYVAIATAIHTAIVLLANVAKPWLTDSTRNQTTRRILSGLLIVIAIWLLIASRYAAG